MSCTNFDLLSVLNPEIRAMKALGFWKSEDKNSMYNCLLYKAYGGVVWLGMAIFQLFGFMLVYKNWHTLSMGDVSSVLFLYITTMNTQTVTTCIILNVDRLHSIIHQLQSEVMQLKTEKHVLVAKRLKTSGDKVRKYFYAILSFVLLAHPVLKLVTKDKEPFYATYIPPALGHVGMLVFQEIMTAVSGCAGCSYICLDMNLMIGISIQIETLKDILRESNDIGILMECIQRHEQIIRLVDNVQHLLCVGLSIHFFNDVLLFCTTLFKVLETGVDFSELIIILPYSLTTIFIMFVHCWYGNDIIHRSAGITNAVFDTNWIGAKLPMQKTVILFMTLTQEPLRIRLAATLFPLVSGTQKYTNTAETKLTTPHIQKHQCKPRYVMTMGNPKTVSDAVNPAKNTVIDIPMDLTSLGNTSLASVIGTTPIPIQNPMNISMTHATGSHEKLPSSNFKCFK
nr:unnamed protein product [Callosobruchus analis]